MLTCRNISLEDDLDWNDLIRESNTATFFQTKEWLQIWAKHWCKSGEIIIYAVFDNDGLIGIAPFHISNKINILGAPDPSVGGSLSDFGDIIAKISYEKEVWRQILELDRVGPFQGPTLLNFVREDSPSLKILQELGGKAEEIEVAPYIDLPKTWDEYLMRLDRHDRHELRRKMRKAESEGVALLRFSGRRDEIEELFRLMKLGNEQKINFLKEEMKEFFKDIINILWTKKMLDLTFLEYNRKGIAAALTFLFKDEVLLYNSGFDARFSHLSPGFLLKALMIKEAAEQGKKRFDFLRGGERYKYDLGGKERKLYKIKFD